MIALMANLLSIPVEIRLLIYDYILSTHWTVVSNQQPSNAHLNVLRVCKQIAREAFPTLQQYISLAHEAQIITFLATVSERKASYIRFADVANDGRMVQHPDRRLVSNFTSH